MGRMWTVIPMSHLAPFFLGGVPLESWPRLTTSSFMTTTVAIPTLLERRQQGQQQQQPQQNPALRSSKKGKAFLTTHDSSAFKDALLERNLALEDEDSTNNSNVVNGKACKENTNKSDNDDDVPALMLTTTKVRTPETDVVVVAKRASD